MPHPRPPPVAGKGAGPRAVSAVALACACSATAAQAEYSGRPVVLARRSAVCKWWVVQDSTVTRVHVSVGTVLPEVDARGTQAAIKHRLLTACSFL